MTVEASKSKIRRVVGQAGEPTELTLQFSSESRPLQNQGELIL